jgi:transcriptional regulator with XRE-family HTH domain
MWGVASSSTGPASPFGVRLRQWRRVRGHSQLRLAAEASSTPRHISFLETGRSRPSRDMVLRLADVLDVPLRDRNVLLHAAGLPPAYPQAEVGAPELEPFRRAIARLLDVHEPYPALAINRNADVVAANQACAALFGEDLVGSNMLQRYLEDGATKIVNWSEVASAALGRLHGQLHQSPLDDALRSQVTLAEAALADLPPRDGVDHSLVVCPWFQIGDTVIRTIVIAARFDSAVDITLDELRIELIYPQDDTAELFFREHARSRNTSGRAQDIAHAQ